MNSIKYHGNCIACGKLISAILQCDDLIPPPKIGFAHQCSLPVSSFEMVYAGSIISAEKKSQKYFTQKYAAEKLGFSKQRVSILIKQKRIKTKFVHGLGEVIELKELRKFKKWQNRPPSHQKVCEG